MDKRKSPKKRRGVPKRAGPKSEILPQPFADAVSEFRVWWDKTQNDADIADRVTLPLYHYTSAVGLSGIVSNEEIWLTSIFHLNDPSELRYGLRAAMDIFRERSKGHHKIIQFMFERVREVMTVEIPKVFGFFVGSFSSDGDELGQWRAYGDDGRGCAVGLAPELFHPHTTDQEALQRAPNEAIVVASGL